MRVVEKTGAREQVVELCPAKTMRSPVNLRRRAGLVLLLKELPGFLGKLSIEGGVVRDDEAGVGDKLLERRCVYFVPRDHLVRNPRQFDDLRWNGVRRLIERLKGPADAGDFTVD